LFKELVDLRALPQLTRLFALAAVPIGSPATGR
jgi:hypothetical protein